MATIDSVRIIALQPLRDFENTSDNAKIVHRYFNLGYSLFTFLLMVIFPILKCKAIHSFLDSGDILQWVFLPLTAMWVLGYRLQLFQSRDICNQPNPRIPIFNQNIYQFVSKESISNQYSLEEYEPAGSTKDDTHPVKSTKSRGPGRPPFPRFDQNVGPMKDEIATAALDEEMGEYADQELGSLEGRYIIDAILSAPYLFTNGEYTIKSLASWLFHRFHSKFPETWDNGLSMTTIRARRYNIDDAKLVKNRMNNRYLRIQRNRKKNN